MLGAPGATEDDVFAAASRAGAHDFISQLLAGYDTVLKTEGTDPSGGQKQRIALARALLKRAPILILDEPTSQVDPESERLIYDSLHSIRDTVTVIVAANHLPVVPDAVITSISAGARGDRSRTSPGGAVASDIPC